MPIALIVDHNGNEGWQARVGTKGPGKTAYFACAKHGPRRARRMALEALVEMELCHTRPKHWRKR